MTRWESSSKYIIDALWQRGSGEIPLDMNWAELNEYGQGLRTLFYTYLQADRIKLPLLIRARFNQLCLLAERKNSRLLVAATEIAALFNREGIPLIFYKGVASLCTIYKECPGARSISDIDLLIQEQFYDRGRLLLESIGFLEQYDQIGLGSPNEAKQWFEEHHFHSIFRRNGIEVELHRNLSFKFEENQLSEIFSTAVPLENNQATLHIPRVEFQILALLINFIHDRTINQGQRWYLENKSRCIAFAFIASCFEIKLLCKYNQEVFDRNYFAQSVARSGYAEKLNFLLSLYSCINGGDMLAAPAKLQNFDSLKALVSSSQLFVDNSIIELAGRDSCKEKLARYLFLFSRIEPRSSPLGKYIFWVHCGLEMFSYHLKLFTGATKAGETVPGRSN